jgi:PLAC8 family
MQRAEVRKKYNLQGSCIEDILLSCCCGCCSLIQQDKEAEYREPLMADAGVKQQYQAPEGMSMPVQQ